ncbi:MAG: amylo-alpha-1,6-glucosidase [Candidatus Woesearchaeota archaeon]
MTRVIYEKKEVETKNPLLLRGSRQGNYLLLSDKPFSRYEGLHIRQLDGNDDWKLYKTVSRVLPEQVNHIKHLPTKTVYAYDEGSCAIHFFDSVISLQIEGNLRIPLVLDCREIYDFEKFGRQYSYECVNDIHIFSYTKESANHPRIYVVCKSDGEFQSHSHWHNVYYSYEHERQSGPWDWYEYFAGDFLNASQVVIGAGFDRDEVISQVEDCWQHQQGAIRTQEKYQQLLSDISVEKHSLELSYALASFDELLTDQGFYAGLPWFFQVWTRDQSISIGALIAQKRFREAKSLLLKQLQAILPDGRLPNRFPHSDLASADGVGWTCKRLFEVLEQMPDIEEQELIFIRDRVVYSVVNQDKHFGRLGFVENADLETWMDTGNPYDTRRGFRIEIQALYASQIQLINYLNERLDDGKYGYFQKWENDFIKSMQEFVRDGVVYDGLHEDGYLDMTIRPNVFLAYYICPSLFSKQVWKKTFDASLEKLFVKWGGVTTISQDHSLYCAHYTGQTNQSYHRGDVWYYVNLIAAQSLYLLDKKKYAPYWRALVESSCHELFASGAMGSLAEVSGASQCQSQGCFMQAWSLAMFIEAVIRIYGQ